MEYVGEVLNTEQFEKRAEEYSNDRNRHYYFMALKSDAIIDATNKGNISRFINHSCDPNAETQKWTVNGELRIGFFSKRNIKRGDEITFDYQFQRYGKEAQKCFCEASNCRGWIGEEPESDESDEVSESESESEEEPATCDSPKASEMQEEENDKVETDKDEKAVKPKPKKSTKQLTDSEDEWIQTQEPEDIEKIKASDKSPKIKKRTLGRWAGRKNKKSMVHRKDIFEDLDLDEEIQMLSRTGLKNQAHTLTLSRLMVRAKETQHRINLLSVIQGGEVPCRRLFLDYHGLRLIYSWMCDSTTNNKSSVLNDKQNEKEFINLRLEILNTLMTLPIPNKTMLQDSKVLTTVEKWSQKLDDSEKSPNSSPSDDSDASRTPILVDEATGLIIDSVKQELDSAKLESKSLNEKDKIGSISKTSPKLENDESSLDNSTDVKPKIEQIDHDNKELLNEEKFDEDAIYFTELRKKLVEVALQLLLNWKSLKEVFRIPKRERIEQMKEHEREANRGYTDPNSERKDIKKYRFKSSGKENTISTLGASGGPTQLRSVVKKLDRNNSSLSKFQRRQLFAERVAAEETEKRLRAGRELWRAHSNHCSLMGFDPLTTPAPDPSTGLPMYYDPVKEEWNTRQLTTGSEEKDASIGMHISQMMPPQPNVMMPPQPNVMMYPNQPAYFPHPGMMMPDQFGQQQIMMPFPNFQNNVVQTLPAPEQQPVMTPTQQIQMMPPGNGPPVMIPPGPHMMTNNQTHLLAPGPVVPGQQHIMMPGQQHGMIPGGPQPMIAPGQHPVITSAQQMMPPFQQSNISMTPEQQQMMTFMMASGQNVIPQPNITAQEEFVDESVIKNSNIDKEKSHRKKNKKKDKKKKDKESVVSEKDTEKINIGAANPYKIPPPEDLPPGWLSAIDQNGRIYYYHSKKRVSQWLPPDMCKNIFGRFNQFEDSDTSDDDELKTESKLIKNIIHNNKIINSDNSDDSDSDNLEDTLLMRQVHGNILSNQSPSALTLKGLDSIRKARHEQLDKSRVVVMKAEAESTTPSDDQHSICEMTIPLNITKPTLNSPVYKPKRVRELQPGSAAFDSLSSPVVNSDSSQVGDVTPQPDDTMNFGDDATGCDSSTLILKDKKRIKRNGLVTEILISPRSEHDRMHQKMEIKRYKENKEKLKMKKYLKMQREIMKVKGMESRHSKPQVVLPVSNPSEESSLPMMIPQALPEENLEKQQILAIKRKSSSHEQNVLHHHQKRLKAIEENKNQTLEKSKEDIPFLFTLSENSKEGLRIKEQFRVDVAKVIVSQLNHFRKPDCLIGRITNTKDFKHLAKKLTHFVMVKELKHCKSVEELTFNESVKVKAKEFVKKYMVKYGDVYVRPPQEAVD